MLHYSPFTFFILSLHDLNSLRFIFLSSPFLSIPSPALIPIASRLDFRSDLQFPGLVSNNAQFFQTFPMVIAEGHLAIIMRTAKASPTMILVTDGLNLCRTRCWNTATDCAKGTDS